LRQGLEQAENQILEPVYKYQLSGPSEFLGRFMSDVQKASGSFEDPVMDQGYVTLTGWVPVVEFMDYSNRLASYTSGKGQITLEAGGYKLCHNETEVLESCGYMKDRDMDYPSGSVFCKKGSSYTVPWDKAKEAMHCIVSMD
jgi:translation elongation factor EF-G